MKPPPDLRAAAALLAAAGLLCSCSTSFTGILGAKAAPPPSPLEARASAGRALAQRFAESIVNVEVVTTIKITVGSRTLPPQEAPIEANGTVISPSGLTITSLSAIDPRGSIENRLRSLGNSQRIQIGDAEYKEAKLRLADGTEIAARVVLKDPDLDLAFIAPDPDAASKRTYPWANLEPAADPVVLGDYYVVGRAPKVLQRAPVVRLVTIEGVVDKPRRLYLINGPILGCPVVDLQGRVLGICLAHISNGRPGAQIVMPAADVAEGAKQAAADAEKPSAASDADDSLPAGAAAQTPP